MFMGLVEELIKEFTIIDSELAKIELKFKEQLAKQ